MIFQFFHDKIKGDEWYVVEQLPGGNYKAICTRQTKVYKLGSVRNFFFDDCEIWTKGKLKPNNHSLTLKTKYDGKPRNTNRSGRKRT
jgi:hypothetical protein